MRDRDGAGQVGGAGDGEVTDIAFVKLPSGEFTTYPEHRGSLLAFPVVAVWRGGLLAARRVGGGPFHPTRKRVDGEETPCHLPAS